VPMASCGPPSVTVGADHLTLFHLIEDALPVASVEPLADGKAFLSEVIELQDERIGLAAVDAGM
jgi:hypothetical protein